MARSTPEDFWRQVDKKAEAPCWLWLGYKNAQGYGILSFAEVTGHGGQISAHRVSWALHTDLLPPKGWHLHHTCRNKSCVNPDHLEMVTASRHRRIHHVEKKWHMATPVVR